MDELALLVASAAFVAGAVCLAATRQLLPSIRVLLDLLLAAGLLRLAGEPRPESLATATAVIAIRRLTATALRRAAGAAKEAS